MQTKLNINGLFRDEDELRETVQRRRLCYDTEPYYIFKKGQSVQIGFQLNLYGTFPDTLTTAEPDSAEYEQVLADVKRLAEVLSKTCSPLHMCESLITESGTITYSTERRMRPEVEVHVPIYDRENFGHAVDENIRNTLHSAEEILAAIGVRKHTWPEH